MKRKLQKVLIGILSIGPFISSAQMVVDSVHTGQGYQSQVWYSMEKGVVESSLKSNWHLAFELENLSSSIHFNATTGNTLYLVPGSDTSKWSNLDTSNYKGWKQLHNSETSWAIGAFNSSADPSNAFDLGWGIYSVITHTVSGNKIFLIAFADGTFKKIRIKSLVSGTFTIEWSNIDNSDNHLVHLAKSSFTEYNFFYFSLLKKTILLYNKSPNSILFDREQGLAVLELFYYTNSRMIPFCRRMHLYESKSAMKFLQEIIC